MRTRSIHKAALTDAVTPLEEAGKKVAYQAAVEGIVLLENDGVLPVKPGKIALYGAGAKMTVKGGTGSGEVNERHAVSILEGMEHAGFEITTMDWIEDSHGLSIDEYVRMMCNYLWYGLSGVGQSNNTLLPEPITVQGRL